MEVLRDGVTTVIKKSHDWEKPKCHALTVPEQEAFVDFVARSPTYRHWSNSFTVLLGTGMRIGECLGLRWEGCNFKGKIINVNHTYSSSHGSREYGDPHHNPEDESRYSHYSELTKGAAYVFLTVIKGSEFSRPSFFNSSST